MAGNTTVRGVIEIKQNIAEQMKIAESSTRNYMKTVKQLEDDIKELERQKIKTGDLDMSDIKEADAELERLKESVAGVSKTKGTARVDADTTAATDAISDIKSKIAGIIGTVALTAVIKGAVTTGLDYNTQMESYQTSFRTMLGNAEEANALMADLQDKAAATPFELTDLASATQLLMNYGMSADKAKDSMMMLGDIAQGDAEKMSRIAMAYGQMSSAGKVQLEDVKQMIEAGFNPLTEISETTGESMESLYDRISHGTIAVDEITAAMVRSTSEGGKYYKSMEAQSQTMAGLKSTAQDLYAQFMGNVTGNMFEELKGGIMELNGEVESAEMQRYAKELGKTLGDITKGAIDLAKGLWDNKEAIVSLAAGVGAYKVATVAADMAQKGLNVTMLASPWGLAAAGIGLVVSAITTMVQKHGEMIAPITDVRDEIDALTTSYESAMDAARKSYDSQIADLQVMQTQINAVDRLIQSDADSRKIDLAVSDLLEQFPELEGAVSNVNGVWEIQRDKVSAVTEEIKRQALAERAKSEYTAAINAREDAADTLEKAKQDKQTYIAEHQDEYAEYQKNQEIIKNGDSDVNAASAELQAANASGDKDRMSQAEQAFNDAIERRENAETALSGSIFTSFDTAIAEATEGLATQDANLAAEEKRYNEKIASIGDTGDETESTTVQPQWSTDVMATLDGVQEAISNYTAAAEYLQNGGDVNTSLRKAGATDEDIKDVGGDVKKAMDYINQKLMEAADRELNESAIAADQALEQYKGELSATDKLQLQNYSSTVKDALDGSSKTAGNSMETAVAWLKTWKLPVDVTVTTTTGGGSAKTPAQNAVGDEYFEGGLTWVGEQGAELVELPKGTRITTAGESPVRAAELASQNSSTNINMTVNIARVDADNEESVHNMMNRLVETLEKAI